MTLEAGNPADVYDPEQGEIPARVAGVLEHLGSANLLLVAGSDARRTGWAERAAVALARAWSARGAGVVLADLCFDDPVLHDLVGVPNDEGVSDIFLFGASLERTVRVAGEGGLALLPAGPFAPDPEAILTDAAWERILAAAAGSGQALWLYVPATAVGIERLAVRVGRALVLASPAESGLVAASLPGGCDVAAVLQPGAEAAPDGGGSMEARVATDVAAVEGASPAEAPAGPASPEDGAETTLAGAAPPEAGASESGSSETAASEVEASGDAPSEAAPASGSAEPAPGDAAEPAPPPAGTTESAAQPAPARAREEVLLGAPEARAGRKKAVWVIAAIVVVGLAAAAAWYFLGLR